MDTLSNCYDSSSVSHANKKHYILLNTIHTKLDLLAITETWIKNDHPDTIKLDLCPPGYSVTHTHRPTDKTGGGVALIVRSDIKVCRIHLNCSYKSFEVLAVHLLVNSTRLNIDVLYRPVIG